MDAKLQARIAPREPLSDFKRADGKKPAVIPAKEQDTDFRELLLNSNREVRLKRDAQANGDLAGASDYQSFLDSLSEVTRQKNMPKNKMDKNDFLTLFVTQLQQQDPLKPKDGAEMASQLAQFNSLEQMMNINSSLERLEQKTQEGQSIRYPDFIGKDVALKLRLFKLEGGVVTEGGYEVNAGVSQSMLEVRGPDGSVIARAEQGPRQPGIHHIEWDGKNDNGEQVPDGVYRFELKTKGANGKESVIPVASRTRVTGIDLKDRKAPFFTSLGKASLDDIFRIGEASESGQTNAPGSGLRSESDSAPRGAAKKISGLTGKKDRA